MGSHSHACRNSWPLQLAWPLRDIQWRWRGGVCQGRGDGQNIAPSVADSIAIATAGTSAGAGAETFVAIAAFFSPRVFALVSYGDQCATNRVDLSAAGDVLEKLLERSTTAMLSQTTVHCNLYFK